MSELTWCITELVFEALETETVEVWAAVVGAKAITVSNTTSPAQFGKPDDGGELSLVLRMATIPLNRCPVIVVSAVDLLV